MLSNKLSSLTSFIVRNLLWILGGIAFFIFLDAGVPEIQTILFIGLLECIAVGLSGAALFIYTKINFIEFLLEGKNKKIDNWDRKPALQLLGSIFIGVHLLVGLTVLGVYIAQFSH